MLYLTFLKKKIRAGSFHIKENNNFWMINKTLIVVKSTFVFRGFGFGKTKIMEAKNVVQWHKCSGCNEPTLLIQELRDMACD